jgi:transcriptional regulator with XRE-family HTH domain
VSARERAVDRGTRRGRELYDRAARELRRSRLERGLSLEQIGKAIGISGSELSRIERGLIPATSLVRLAQLHAVVGNELAVQVFPGGTPLRDAGHVQLLGTLRSRLHPSWRWSNEVPLPIPGDQRAWDAMATLDGYRCGIEAETSATDSQALARRLQLKLRDGAVDALLLVLPDTRRTRGFLVAARSVLDGLFPVPGRRALELLGAGVPPGGNAIIVLSRRHPAV